MNVNQMVAIKLLNAISRSNANNKNSLSNKTDMFDMILQNTLGNMVDSNNSCSCNHNNKTEENSLDTLIGSMNVNKIDTPNSINKISTSNTQKTSDKMDNAVKMLEDQLGKPYVWGATGPDSFDCSGLVQYIYKNALGKDIPRVSYDQSKFGKEVDKKDLQVGDLVFFDTMNKGRVSHVGMYIGNNEFIHASNRRDGVKKSTLTGYYESRFRGARRP